LCFRFTAGVNWIIMKGFLKGVEKSEKLRYNQGL
jgi:hypothetical protein